MSVVWQWIGQVWTLTWLGENGRDELTKKLQTNPPQLVTAFYCSTSEKECYFRNKIQPGLLDPLSTFIYFPIDGYVHTTLCFSHVASVVNCLKGNRKNSGDLKSILMFRQLQRSHVTPIINEHKKRAFCEEEHWRAAPSYSHFLIFWWYRSIIALSLGTLLR